MKVYFAKGKRNSDKKSDSFFYVNNCGCYKDMDCDAFVERTHGRSDFQLIYIKSGAGEFYINNKDDNDIKVIIEVINSICTAHYGNSTPEFNKQISDFVTEFKKENLHFLFENQTMPVFKMYQENIAAL